MEVWEDPQDVRAESEHVHGNFGVKLCDLMVETFHISAPAFGPPHANAAERHAL